MTAAYEPKGDIIVAINFDDLAHALVRVAGALAAASHRALRLIHVFSTEYPSIINQYESPHERWEPLPDTWDEGWAAPYLGAPSSLRVGRRVDPSMEQAEAYLASLAAAEVDGGVITRTTVVAGEFPDALIGFAAQNRGSLVVVGAPLHRAGLLKSKLRPTLKLMARSPVPVLAVADPEARLDIRTRPLRLLIADDLTAASLPAIAAAAELLDAAGVAADVLHLHVEAQPPPGFGDAFDPELAVWPGISIKERLVNDHHEQLEKRLAVRGARLANRLEGVGGSYVTALWQGNVSQELRRAAQVHGADLVVFGRHHFLHRQPLALGQMPFPSMLGVSSAVMVAAAPHSG